MTSTAQLLTEVTDSAAPTGILDEGAKREIRRAALSAVVIVLAGCDGGSASSATPAWCVWRIGSRIIRHPSEANACIKVSS